MMRAIVILLFALWVAAPAQAEDGYRLWLRYEPVGAPLASNYASHARAIVAPRSSPTLRAAQVELERGLQGLLGRRTPVVPRPVEGAIILGTPATSPIIRSLRLPLSPLGRDGYLIRTLGTPGRRYTVIAANSDLGVLYGTFALLRRMQTHQPIANLRFSDAPTYPLRLLNHWDNLDRTIERGYAGPSIWDWSTLPQIEQRYIDYARANASVGINGAVLNSVNADPRVLTPEYLAKAAGVADALRPYGVRVYLTARFSSPVEIGHLKTADPMDPQVKAWWKAKGDEIYRLVPDFGGFLIKANSEGEPGPWDYKRTQADGANTIADALAPHGGTVFWRAFVYAATKEDRAKQAYSEFRPLDGKFRRNVIVQVKNGPIDFQPREPFSPLFGQMPHTRIGLEVQLTREYLGQSDGVVYLAPMWSETLDSDTCSPRCSTPVKNTVDAMAGVSNVGSNRHWAATNFDQANWFALGRLAWNPSLSPRSIAEDWTRMTWTNDPRAVEPIVAMMLNSREAVVNYMTPLGLTHQFANDHHYGPAPWSCSFAQANWNPCYYNQADKSGIGFDRTPSGTNAAGQYAPPVARAFSNLATVPDKDLLWFHHVPWTHRLRDGRTLWESLIDHYDAGVATVDANRRQWIALRPFIDSERHSQVITDLDRQLLEARWWRDASIAYWQSLSGLPLPSGHSPPAHPLKWYEDIRFDNVPGFKIPRIVPGTLCVAGRGGPSCASSP
jgi:alpha-glucuronidase